MSSLRWPLLATILLAALRPLPAAAAENLERELLRQAPGVWKSLKDRGYHNVGVLDFLIGKDEQSFRDNSGGLRLFLAQQLEVALVLANDPHQPLGLIPSAVISQRTPLANPHTRAGRRTLLSVRFPLAWGEQEVLADAFITGTVLVGRDRKTLTIRLFAFDRTEEGAVPVGEEFTVPLPRDRLGSLGESFGDGLRPMLAPVSLEVRYDGQAVPVQVRDGQAFVPEPKEGQKLELFLKHNGGKERHGVVLKVNGENTLERQRLPDLRCRRWLLGPDNTSLVIRGFQNEDNNLSPFPVLSVQEIRERRLLKGEGPTFTLTVFRERQDRGPAPDISDEAVAATAVAMAVLPARRPANFHALKASLLEESNYNALLVKEEEAASTSQRVRFRPEPMPVLCLTIGSVPR